MAQIPIPVAAGAHGVGHRWPGGRRMVAVFAVTQTIGYGSLYYSFAVLLHPIAVDLQVSAAAVTGTFTTAEPVAPICFAGRAATPRRPSTTVRPSA